MYAPALLLAIPFLTGAAVAFLSISHLQHLPEILVGGAAVLGLLAAIGSYLIDDRPAAAALIVASAVLTGLSLGLTDARRVYGTPLAAWFAATPSGITATLQGVLTEDASPTAAGSSLLLDVTAIETSGRSLMKVSGGVRLSVAGTLLADRARGWRAGRTVRVPAFLRQPSTYLNPGTPDERPALARRGIVLVGSVKSGALVEVVAQGSPPSEAAAALRAAIRRRLNARLGEIDLKAAGVTTAVLIGDRSGLAPDDERRLQDAGTYHVIAISGGNIAVLAVLSTLVARLFFVPPSPASIVTALLLVFYGMVASGAASVARAVTAAVLVLLARALDHRVHAINVLAVAALFAVACAPAVVLDPGFHLSFGATLGILLGVPRINRRFRSARRRASGWRLPVLAAIGMLAATVCAEMALAPVSATLFGRVSFAGLFLNFAAIPLMTVIQIAGLIVAATPSWAGPIAQGAATALRVSAGLLLESAKVVDAAPWLAHDVAPPVCGLTIAYYASALALLSARTCRVAIPGYVLSATLLVIGPREVARDAVSPPSMPVRVVVLDVGQGDATVVALPGARAVLVDTGGIAPVTTGPDAFDAPPGFDIGDRVVARVLRALGVRRLDALVVTHGDPDHVLGARGVLKHLATDAIWEGVPVPPHPGLRSLAAFARNESVTWRTVRAGDIERVGDVELRVLHPPPPDWERQRVRNDDSVVLEIRIGAVSVVLPGDIGKEGERAILPRLEQGRLVILKAPHHGSATSSSQELLDRLRPKAVIVSCGRNNRFGHPHPTVLERYRTMGSAIFSTAEDGAVFVETDGQRVDIRGWEGRQISIERLPPHRGTPADTRPTKLTRQPTSGSVD
jgi:competence protein ComEC